MREQEHVQYDKQKREQVRQAEAGTTTAAAILNLVIFRHAHVFPQFNIPHFLFPFSLDFKIHIGSVHLTSQSTNGGVYGFLRLYCPRYSLIQYPNL